MSAGCPKIFVTCPNAKPHRRDALLLPVPKLENSIPPGTRPSPCWPVRASDVVSTATQAPGSPFPLDLPPSGKASNRSHSPDETVSTLQRSLLCSDRFQGLDLHLFLRQTWPRLPWIDPALSSSDHPRSAFTTVSVKHLGSPPRDEDRDTFEDSGRPPATSLPALLEQETVSGGPRLLGDPSKA